MEYRKIGRSGLELSAITFGAWAAGGWMWGHTDRFDAMEAIRASYDLGVTSFDTAPIYGQGTSEEIVGEALIGFVPRDKFQILTKFGMRWDLAKGDFAFKSKNNQGKEIDIYKYAGRASIIKECEDSLRRLRTDYIDLYQIHWPDSTTLIEESMEAVATLIKQGKVRYAGVCNYSAEQMEEAETHLPIVSNQVPYSMVNLGIESDVVPHCMKNKKGILAYSPLQRGLLTGKMKPGYKFQQGDHRAGLSFFTDESISRTNEFLQKIKPIADSKNVTLSQLVLRWTIDQPGITIALAGARNAEQATMNAKAADVKFVDEELKEIDDILLSLMHAEL
jgi:aryl-alcohol dehydrogenase-like predicted oxidoreductase